jgi:hypothetical protein
LLIVGLFEHHRAGGIPLKASAKRLLWSAAGTFLSLMIAFVSGALLFGAMWGFGYYGYKDRTPGNVHYIYLLYLFLVVTAVGQLVLAIRFLFPGRISKVLSLFSLGPAVAWVLCYFGNGIDWDGWIGQCSLLLVVLTLLGSANIWVAEGRHR